MDQDTDIGGPQQRFPVTRHSAIIAAQSSDEEVRRRGMETIIASYWKPVYKYIRIKWQEPNEEAKDLTQAFFLTSIEKNYFASYDRTMASFQTFLRTCLDRFIANQKKANHRLKRGGHLSHLALDFDDAEAELSRSGSEVELTPEDYFRREWVRNFFSLCLENMRTRFNETGRGVYFELFEIYDLNDDDTSLTYADLAKRFNLSISDVTNYLAAARREFRKILSEKLREITANETEFRSELRALLGIDL